MSYRQCVVPQASANPDEPGFEIRETSIPQELTGDDVLLKVLVSPSSLLFLLRMCLEPAGYCLYSVVLYSVGGI